MGRRPLAFKLLAEGDEDFEIVNANSGDDILELVLAGWQETQRCVLES